MNNQNEYELDISEYSYKQAVLALKIVEAAGEHHDDVHHLQKQAENCLASDRATRRTFGLNLLRFLYKKGLISIGWLYKRRIRGFLKTDPSESVRLAAFDLLGAVLTKTGSKSGVRESDYLSILDFREKMLEKSPTLRKYESSYVSDDIKRLRAEADTKLILNRIIESLS